MKRKNLYHLVITLIFTFLSGISTSLANVENHTLKFYNNDTGYKVTDPFVAENQQGLIYSRIKTNSLTDNTSASQSGFYLDNSHWVSAVFDNQQAAQVRHYAYWDNAQSKESNFINIKSTSSQLLRLQVISDVNITYTDTVQPNDFFPKSNASIGYPNIGSIDNGEYSIPRYTVQAVPVSPISISNLTANNSSSNISIAEGDTLNLAWTPTADVLVTSKCILTRNGDTIAEYNNINDSDNGDLNEGIEISVDQSGLSAGTYNYHLSCSHNGVGEETENVRVTIITPPQVSMNFDTPIDYNATSTISWTATNEASSCRVLRWNESQFENYSDSLSYPNTQSYTTPPLTSNQTFRVKCWNGTAGYSDEQEVQVRPQAKFSNVPSEVLQGEPFTVSWLNDNADFCSASSVPSDDEWSGTLSGNEKEISLAESTSLDLTCQNNGGSLETTDLTSVNVLKPEITRIWGNGEENITTIDYSGEVQVTWETNGHFADSGTCTLYDSDNNPIGDSQDIRALDNGNITVSNIATSDTYTLKCNNGYGYLT